MANFNASVITRSIAAPPQKNRVDQYHGRLRMWMSVYQAPASGTTPAIGDKIIWGQLPLGANILPHLGQLACNLGTALSTLTVGDNMLATRHLAASTVAVAGVFTLGIATPFSTLVKASTMTTLSGSFQLTSALGIGAAAVGDLCVGPGIPLASYVTAVDVANRTVTFGNLANAPATASAAVAVTFTGYPWRISDNTANADNLYVSTTDDATLISVVAGAQIANNQIIRVMMPYVMD